MEASLRRLSELLVYVAWRTQEDGTFGAVKLNKALFYSDFRAYQRLGEPITGAFYWKLDHGPVPKALPVVRGRLLEDGSIERRDLMMGNRLLSKIYARRQPDVSLFSPQQLDLLETVLDEFRGKTATQISLDTHALDCWRLAKHKQEIPYFAFLLPNGRRPSVEAVEYGRALVARLNGQDEPAV